MSFLLGPGLLVDATVDGRNPANHLGCKKPCKYWDELPTSTVAATQADLFYIPAFFSVLFWIGDLEAPET